MIRTCQAKTAETKTRNVKTQQEVLQTMGRRPWQVSGHLRKAESEKCQARSEFLVAGPSTEYFPYALTEAPATAEPAEPLHSI